MEKTTKTIKIALVDDHILLRDALATVVNAFEDCKVILTAKSGRDFIDHIQPGNLPDIIILDLNMPDIDGYETTKWVRNNYPDIPVLILTMYDSEIALIRLLQNGARGFLKKDIHPGELRSAIESVVNTGYYYSYNSTGRLVNLFKNNGTKKIAPNATMLSENELSFLKLASTDLTYKEIAMHMSISPRTVDNYRDSLFLKLNVKSRVGLAIYAIKYGIVTLAY